MKVALRAARLMLLRVFVIAGVVSAIGTVIHMPDTNASPHVRWVKVHNAIVEDSALIGCGDYRHGHWSEGFWAVSWDDLRDQRPYELCDRLVREGVLP